MRQGGAAGQHSATKVARVSAASLTFRSQNRRFDRNPIAALLDPGLRTSVVPDACTPDDDRRGVKNLRKVLPG